MSCAISRNTYTPNDFCDHRAASSHAFLWWFFYLLQTKKNLLAFRSWCFDCCPGTTLKTRWMGEQTVNSQSFISVWRKSLHLTAHWTKLFWKQLLAFLFFFFLIFVQDTQVSCKMPSLACRTMAKYGGAFTLLPQHAVPAHCGLKNRKTTAEEGSRVTPCVTLQLSLFPQ